MTVRDLIRRSLKILGVLGGLENPNANEMTDAFSSLNALIDDWSNQSLLIYQKLPETFPLVAGKQVYTMGPAGDFATARPQLIENAGIVTGSPAVELPMSILNKDQWASTTVKQTTSSIPCAIYNDSSFPLSNIYVWPVPSAAASIVLYSWKPLAEFVTVNDTVNLPPGYLRALIYNLAVELQPEYGVEPRQDVVAIAVDTKASIKRMNSKPIYLHLDSAMAPSNKPFNWLTGE